MSDTHNGSPKTQKGMDRRSFIKSAALGAGVVGASVFVAKAARAATATPHRQAVAASAAKKTSFQPSGRATLGPLAPGDKVGAWTIRDIFAVTLGAVPIVLVGENGKAFQVDVMRRNTQGREGVGNTKHLSVFVSNYGNGHRHTAEHEGMGAMALAKALAPHDHEIASGLLTMEQRHAKFPKGFFQVLR